MQTRNAIFFKHEISQKNFTKFYKHSLRQTSSAISLTRASFAHCSSSVSLLPISQDAKPSCELVHGGEEASIVSYRIPEMEIVGIAPYSRGAHTPKERLHLDTMLPIWQFLIDLLCRLSEE